jgi:hypothetical protein
MKAALGGHDVDVPVLEPPPLQWSELGQHCANIYRLP